MGVEDTDLFALEAAVLRRMQAGVRSDSGASPAAPALDGAVSGGNGACVATSSGAADSTVLVGGATAHQSPAADSSQLASAQHVSPTKVEPHRASLDIAGSALTRSLN